MMLVSRIFCNLNIIYGKWHFITIQTFFLKNTFTLHRSELLCTWHSFSQKLLANHSESHEPPLYFSTSGTSQSLLLFLFTIPSSCSQCPPSLSAPLAFPYRGILIFRNCAVRYTWFPCKAAGVVCKLQSLLSSRLCLNLMVKPNHRVVMMFPVKMWQHDDCCDACALCRQCWAPIRYFFVIWTSPDCYAPAVAPPSCPPLTALVTHAVYSPRAEGKTGDELHLLSKCCRVWIRLSFFLPLHRNKGWFSKINSDLTLCCSAVPRRSVVKVQQISKALHRNAFLSQREIMSQQLWPK